VLRVAVIGSGPSGIYAAESLLRARPDAVAVDVYDRLPAPFGLVRYGVAPDHLKIKSITRALAKTLAHPAVRFLGDVEIGVAPTVEQLRAHYDAVVYAFGAARDRRLEVPGEDLHGSLSAVEFVSWYSGHPDAELDAALLSARSAVVIGAGNVALDVARVLAKDPADLRPTDLPAHVLTVLEASTVRDVHLLARRGPAQVKFTTKELRELGEIDGLDVLVDPADLELDPVSEQACSDREVARNVEALRAYAAAPATGAVRRLHLHFWLAPTALLGGEHVTGVRADRTRLTSAGTLERTGESIDLDTQLVLRSVGYRGAAIPGVPLDERAGVVPNEVGRVLRAGAVSPGEYVVGWIKRGPTGVIGTNRSDAAETVAALLADLPDGTGRADGDPPGLDRALVVDWDGWLAIDAAEEAAGAQDGRGRVKLAAWEELRTAARAIASATKPDGSGARV
jgi:ferredoxin--NADP+ reductase